MNNPTSPLDTFEHVVVLMLENRSFDNIFGYLYQDGVPPGKSFAGVVGHVPPLTNPDIHGAPVPVSVCTDFHQPFPDPGEEFDHITLQIYNAKDSSGPRNMQGFVVDYYNTLQELEGRKWPKKNWPGSPDDQSRAILRCFTPASLPVLSTLAREFAVFDHWFCAVPSQTWCNRAFWHAATSWGWVNNPPALAPTNPWNLEHWAHSSAGPTLFDQLEQKFGRGSWHVYEDLEVPFTKLVHWGDLKDKVGRDYFRYLDGGHPFHGNFFDDCAGGELPKYSFIEPHFVNFFEDAPWHDDMHPSSFDSLLYANGGPGSVVLGDKLVWRVYQAIRNSKNPNGSNASNTLFIITFDEHGGCYDHVAPPPVTPPDRKAFNDQKSEEDFDFCRLGVRVPMVMVSQHIQRHTIVNRPMDHCSFLQTMSGKWALGSLGSRQDAAPPFTEVFAPAPRSDPWPDFPTYPGPATTPDAALLAALQLGEAPLNDLQGSIFGAIQHLYSRELAASGITVRSAQDALTLLGRIKAQRVTTR